MAILRLAKQQPSARLFATPQEHAIPSTWSVATYGPSTPVQPLAQRPVDGDNPREVDYPIAVNANIKTRPAYGLLPTETLKSAYDVIAEVALPIHTIIRELLSFEPQLVDENGNEVFDHPLAWLTESPDRQSPYATWLTRFLKCSLIYDAGCFSVDQSHGNLDGLGYIDGSTLSLLINERGRLPMPHEVSPDATIQAQYISKARKWVQDGNELPRTTPAFTQIIHGTPFAWYDQDQIWYAPRSRTVDTPYGESFIERAFAWINIVANVTGFELAHYTTGNMPEGIVQAPADWTKDQILDWENSFNLRMTSGPAERMRVRFLPLGFEYKDTKKPDFPEALYSRASDNISLMIGLPPAEHGKTPGAGLGGKGFGEAQQDTLYRNALLPVKTHIEGGFNAILDRFGVDDVRYRLSQPSVDPDPEKQQASIVSLFVSGINTLNQTLGALGQDKVPGGDIRFIISGGQVINLTDLIKSGSPTPQPQSSADVAQGQQMLDTVARTGSITGGRTISIPASATTAKKSKSEAGYTDVSKTPGQRCIGCAHFQKGNQCEIVDDMIAVAGWCKFFEAPKVVGKSASSDILEKHCGVCLEDDDYFGAPISREATIDFPATGHANGMEIVAMCPDGLPPKPALWKPEGDEVLALQDRVGGPQYVREEAAYLIDRSLNFMLVPVAYVADSYGESGAAIYYTHDMLPARSPDSYDPTWIEKAGVLDCIIGQQDRQAHNWGTHHDNPTRMILFDNGLSFCTDGSNDVYSCFYDLIAGQPLSPLTIAALTQTLYDSSTWHDVTVLVGAVATEAARGRIKALLAMSED